MVNQNRLWAYLRQLPDLWLQKTQLLDHPFPLTVPLHANPCVLLGPRSLVCSNIAHDFLVMRRRYGRDY